MIIVDTSIWADHFRLEITQIDHLLNLDEIRHHPLVTAELAMGNLRNWRRTVTLLNGLPQAPQLGNNELMDFVEEAGLSGTGIGVVDAHLLASARLSSGLIWTRDRRLAIQAERLGLTYHF